MKTLKFDTIVAGVGSVGAAACYHLARRGARVLGVEQFNIPHVRGSHHGHSRMIRQAYYEHPDYVPLLRRSYELWEELQSGSALSPFFHLTGGLYIGSDDGTIVAGSRLAAEQHGLEYEMLDAGEVKNRFPAFAPDCNHTGFYETKAGFLVPERAISAHAEAATNLGATLVTGETVEGWTAHQDHVEVRTSLATYQADQLVIASGAWTGEVAAELGIELKVTRQVLAWFEPLGDRARFAPENLPCWFIETEPPYGHYGFPVMPGDFGLKVALHRPGSPIELAHLSAEDHQPRQDEIDGLRTVLERYLPGCAGDLIHTCTCRYTNSPDGHFIIGKHPRHDRISIACGLSGHGFKFSSVIGEILADLALFGRSALAVEFLSPARFQ
ncbi:MAG: N-methyl-L-tryptophan oxidase [Verrucomicrobiae bacterium]|nr:N-methyl-L-tryptophan oxidase [Verrucomicrobiae bacterium]